MMSSTSNVFEAVLGRKAIKWDAFWHFFEWLLNPDEGHGLGDTIRLQLLTFTFGQSYTDCTVRREYPVSGQTDGKGKWADFALGVPTLNDPTHLIIMDDIGAASSGAQRKLQNLVEYVTLSRHAHPETTIRVVAVSDAPAGTKLAAVVYQTLGAEAAEFVASTGWRVLPLQTIGTWVRDAMTARAENLSEKMTAVLHDFVDWCC